MTSFPVPVVAQLPEKKAPQFASATLSVSGVALHFTALGIWPPMPAPTVTNTVPDPRFIDGELHVVPEVHDQLEADPGFLSAKDIEPPPPPWLPRPGPGNISPPICADAGEHTPKAIETKAITL